MKPTRWDPGSAGAIRHLYAAAAATRLLAAVGCDSESPSGPRPTPSIGVALSAPALSLTQGENGTVVVSLTRAGGYAGAIALSLEGAPEGVTGTFVPATVASGSSSSTLTLSSVPAEEFGTFPLTVRATGQEGVAERTATLALSVARAPEPGFTLALEPEEITIPQGGTGTLLLRATRSDGRTAPIQSVVTASPAGLAIGLPTIAADTGSIQLSTVSGEGTLAPGTYSVSLRSWTTASSFELTSTFTVHVTPAP